MGVALRPLEREDLGFVHRLYNDRNVMSYWFEEPFDSLTELRDLYDHHVHDTRERRFVIEHGVEAVGVVELVEIDHIHRNAEFQIIVSPDHQGRGHATAATDLALDYAFAVLNLHKVYLIVDVENRGAIRIYERAGFRVEGELREEFFANGRYRDALRMSVLQAEYLERRAG
ncbi:spermidine N1-acetyltransferase [Actinokineospora soli]|uniref:Spermidine N1-acetyltransferase n=1 Tax=Actinokineospora soli TaxID=1048753 RepID=A0ABW2THU4_9PSEU